ncbi:recombinase family protein [Bradyrhizobium sp. I1.7.5]|uniref:recombinase family protein n=1 Tax=Bradyrhizobium sp. I1.7.5 TaxID=3156363 RepID=UPI0033934CBB
MAQGIMPNRALQQVGQLCGGVAPELRALSLDRLSRDAHFLLGLQKAGVKFIAADMPEANEMVVGIMALVAQAERRMISERTKAALQAVKARGKRLGRPKGHQIPSNLETRAKGSAANAVAFAERLRPVLTELASLSANAAAAELDRRGVQTALGGKWTARAVINVRARLAD